MQRRMGSLYGYAFTPSSRAKQQKPEHERVSSWARSCIAHIEHNQKNVWMHGQDSKEGKEHVKHACEVNGLEDLSQTSRQDSSFIYKQRAEILAQP
eukprot:360291-Chlamydomonas_euryale.AAC.8